MKNLAYNIVIIVYSFEQVVHECSEAAKVAISIKQSYQYFLTPVTKKYNITDDTFERYIERFNCDLKEILEVCKHGWHTEFKFLRDAMNRSQPDVFLLYISVVGAETSLLWPEPPKQIEYFSPFYCKVYSFAFHCFSYSILC